jgi:hypothetical protein
VHADHDPHCRPGSYDRLRSKLESAALGRLDVELEDGGNGAGVGADAWQSLLVIGDAQSSERHFRIASAAPDRAGHSPSTPGNRIPGDLDVDAPETLAEFDDAAAPPPAAPR